MTHRRSVTRRLKQGLGLVTLVGMVLLLAAVAFFYWKPFSALPAPEAARLSVVEMLDHVALPLAVLMGPVVYVALSVIRQAFRPLEEAAEQIEAARGHERGFRIDGSRMPTEALPFVDAVNDLLGRLDNAAHRHEAFAADVAHELRTPLAVLSLELDRLEHGGVGSADAARLKADVASMRRLVEQLMLLAQVDAAAAAQMAWEEVALAAVAADVVELMAPSIIASGRTIALEAGDEAITVRGRREAIAAALRNLIENAARATPEGGSIRVRIDAAGRIVVADDGPGLAPERLRDLVQRHRRADHASRDGAGLGLAIVDRIMAAHGGVLETRPEARELVLCFGHGVRDPSASAASWAAC